MKLIKLLLSLLLTITCTSCGTVNNELTLWNQDGVINELVEYVDDVTNRMSVNYICEEDRIAVFDLDGTLICEQFPTYIEWLMFAYRVLGDETYTNQTTEQIELAYRILDAGVSKNIAEDIEEKEFELFGSLFAGMSIEDYNTYVFNFLNKQADGFDGLKFSEAYYKPMVEVVNYLEDNDFTVYVVSGTDRSFDRIMISYFLDIPTNQVIGSDYYTEGSKHTGEYYLDYQLDADESLVRTGNRIIKDVKSSKAVQIAQEIGKKPVLAFGNSTGDYSMFTYVTYNNKYKSIAFCIVPDDDEREYANMAKVESLTKTCEDNGWHVVSMKDDFLTIYGNDIKKNSDNLSFVNSLLNK